MIESFIAALERRSIVSEALRSPLPQLVSGRSGHARSAGLSIWYEAVPPEGASKGAVLLMSGMNEDAFGWPRAFIEAFLARGYMVVRYDHRGVGLSDWDIEATPFTLSDMADDARAVLDALGIDRAHVVGHSMGGMIAQQFALDHPDRTLSLTSMGSSANVADGRIAAASLFAQARLVFAWTKHVLRRGGERSMLRVKFAERRILMGRRKYVLDLRGIAEAVLYNLRCRRGYNLRAIEPHFRAIGRSGSREAALGELRVPALVVHGTDDRLTTFDHGYATARAIPNARRLWVEGMGHDIPDPLAGDFARAIVSL